MGKVLETLSDDEIRWVNQQKLFFVASAPMDPNGHVNCSPKGGDCFRLRSSTEFIYADYTGSGVETAAHLLENRRICVMFCAFDGAPKIMRLHGIGEVVGYADTRFDEYRQLLPEHPGIRAYIRVAITRIGSSCGFQVPLFDYVGERDVLRKWSENKGSAGLEQYRQEKNARSIDGLPVPLFAPLS